MGCLENNCQHTDLTMLIAHCQQRHIKLTPLRQAILGIVASANTPLTAYAILDELRRERPKAQVMSVYRVLNFLLDNGLIHRIESLNAFVLCHHLNQRDHLSQWLICSVCGGITEYVSPLAEQHYNDIAEQTGFEVATSVIELSGRCQACRQAEDSA